MKKIFAMFSILLCCLCCAACSYGYSSIEEAEADGARLGECITIDGVNVSGMSPAEALEAVETAHTEALKALYYTVSAGEDSLDISGSLLPVAFNTREVILEALSLKKYWPAANEARQLHTSMTADSGELKAALEQQSASLQYAPENAGANYDKAKGGFRYTEHRDGRSIDFDDLTSQISALITGSSGGSVTAKSSPILPEYTTDMVKADTQLISEFSTSFAGGTYGKANRVFNICKAADMIDGVTLAPGEEFDMNAAIGDRNKDNGWKTNVVAAQSDALMEVASGTSDAAIIDLLMAGAMIGEGTSYPDLKYTDKLTTEEYGVGCRKGSDLVSYINSVFASSYADGTMKATAEKYGVQEAIVEQKDAEYVKNDDSDVEYIKNKGTLVVGITDFEPMDYKSEDGKEWIGFDADMAKLVAEKLGVEVQFVEIDWDNKSMELDSKTIDVVWNGMTITDEVTAAMDCTNAYCNNAQVVVVSNK